MVHNLISRWWRLALLIPLLFVAACNSSSGTKDKPAQAPQNFTVTPGDGYVTISWTDDPSLTYWIFGAAAASITPENHASFPQSFRNWGPQVRSPYLVNGLVNGTTYSFVMNSTNDGSGAGPATTSISVTPRPAGTSWTSTTVGNVDFNAIQYNANLGNYLVVGNGGKAYTSTDGSNWTAQSTGVTTDLVGLFYDNVRYLALASDGKILISTDGITWTSKALTTGPTPKMRHLVSAAGALVYFAVGENGTFISAAPETGDAKELGPWTLQPTGTTANLNRGFYGGENFVVVGEGGTILSSVDGKTWTKQNSGTMADLHGIYYTSVNVKDPTTQVETAVNAYFVVGKNGTVLRSISQSERTDAEGKNPRLVNDLKTWTVEDSGTTQNLYAISRYSQLLAVGANGTAVMRGSDGKWAAVSIGNGAQYTDLAAGVARYVAVGKAGAIATAK